MRKIHQKAISYFVDLCEEITTPNLSVRRVDNPDFSTYNKFSGVYVLYSYDLPIAIREPIAYGQGLFTIAKYDSKNPAYFEKLDEMTGERIFQKSATTACHVSNLITYIQGQTSVDIKNPYYYKYIKFRPEQFRTYLQNLKEEMLQ